MLKTKAIANCHQYQACAAETHFRIILTNAKKDNLKNAKEIRLLNMKALNSRRTKAKYVS